jgi:acetate kinase
MSRLGSGRADTDTLVVNSGSTSLKLALFGAPDRPAPLWQGEVAGANIAADRVAGIERAIRAIPVPLDRVGAVGHRIVHGADRFDRPTVVDARVEAAIASIAELAPLHNRVGLDGIEAARRVVGESVVHIAVFDTAFHRTIPPAAFAYGGPRGWIERGLRRYGFHGISHQHAASAAARLLSRPVTELALVTCHLGGGCSLAAVAGGRSVDTTMGFTPLDGLVMATRSGSVDPALVVHLLRHGSTLDEVEHLLEHESGLLGLSGVSDDLREVITARDAGSADAELAVDVFVHRLATGVGAMIAALGRLDAIVFTGGIGEHSPEVRSRVVARLAPFGARLDDAMNQRTHADGLISTAESSVAVLVVTAREEEAIARAVCDLVASTAS